MMRKAYRIFATIISIAISAVLATALYIQSTLPDTFFVVRGEELKVYSNYDIRVTRVSGGESVQAFAPNLGGYDVDIKLVGGVSLKSARVQPIERKMVVPCGTPFGIKMFIEGVMVVGLTDIEVNGSLVNPAKAAGIKMGDIILEVNGTAVTSNETMGEIIQKSNGRTVSVKIRRKSAVYNLSLTPVYSELESRYKAGVWIRDSSAGIGTMTYYDPASKVFAGLGHAVCDVDTGEVMPLLSGEILDARITGVIKGQTGAPGELKGMFINSKVLGKLSLNSDMGVFGYLNQIPVHADPIPLAMKHEVKEGPAKIISTISGNIPVEYDIMIERINLTDSNPTKNMVIKITDHRLLEDAGGIVQGMSGSPILQDGALIGAVTHVFVNDPTRGYGIFAENMDKASQHVTAALKMVS